MSVVIENTVDSFGVVAASYPSCLDTNTVAWYDYDEEYITKDESNLVSQWDDRSDNGYHLIQPTEGYRPVWGSDTGVVFDGSDNRLYNTSVDGDKPLYFYAVIKQITWSSGDTFWDCEDASIMNTYNVGQNPTAQGGEEPDIRAYGGENLTHDGFTCGSWVVLRVLFNAASSIIKVDDGTPVTGDTGTLTERVGVGLSLGSRGIYSLGYYSNMAIKELIIRSVADSSEVSDEIYSYLVTKYSL